MSTRIPADVDVPDRVLGPLTVRQVAILAGTAALVWGMWSALREVVAGWLFTVGAVPLVVAALALALIRRDGLGLDRLARLGVAFRLGPRRLYREDPEHAYGGGRDAGAWRVPDWVHDHATDEDDDTEDGHEYGGGYGGGGSGGGAGAGWDTRLRGGRGGRLRVGAYGVGEHGWGGLRVGVIELGAGGVAVLASCSTVNFGLRHDGEQAGLLACFARLLASTAGPLQIVVRTQPLDLSGAIAALDRAIPTLFPPALAAAAAGHRDYLADVAAAGALTRHVLLVLREPVPGATDPSARRPDRTERGHGGAGEHGHDRPDGTGGGGPARESAVARLLGRLGEAQRCLAPAEIRVRPLDAHATLAALAAAADPDRPLDLLATTEAPVGPPRTTGHPHRPTRHEGRWTR